MELFKQEEIINYLTAIQVQSSVYEYVVRTTEADKVRCGEQHFKALEIPFAVVVDDTGVWKALLIHNCCELLSTLPEISELI